MLIPTRTKQLDAHWARESSLKSGNHLISKFTKHKVTPTHTRALTLTHTDRQGFFE